MTINIKIILVYDRQMTTPRQSFLCRIFKMTMSPIGTIGYLDARPLVIENVSWSRPELGSGQLKHI